MNADGLSEKIKTNPAQFVGDLGSSIRKFLTDETGPPEKWWISYREPTEYGLDRWKEDGGFDPENFDTWTIQEQENAKKFLKLQKIWGAASRIDIFLDFIGLNGTLVDPPRQLSTLQKLSPSPDSGRCTEFLLEFDFAFNFLCNLFIPDKSCSLIQGFQYCSPFDDSSCKKMYDTCIAGSQWLEAIGNIPESLRINLPVAMATTQEIVESQEVNAGLASIKPDGREAVVLITMLEKAIDSPDRRKSQQEILKIALGKHSDANDHRRVFTRLLTLGFILKGYNSKGFYLSELGKLAAIQLQRNCRPDATDILNHSKTSHKQTTI